MVIGEPFPPSDPESNAASFDLEPVESISNTPDARLPTLARCPVFLGGVVGQLL